MVVKTLLVLTSIFAIYANVFSLWAPIVIRGVFWGFMAMVVFLGTKRVHQKRWELYIDIILALLAAFCTAMLVFRWEEFSWGIHDPSFLECAVGVVMIILVLEATRRVIGWTLGGMTIIFLLYGLYGNYAPGFLEINGYTISRLTTFLFWDTHGLYGLPMYISASYVVLFVIFGALLLRSGGEKWFMDMSYAAVGRIRGGPALTAVVSSAFFGMMSGSPVANVVTTGSFTIPLMKEIGFKKRVAGAVEAVASTAGMFTPPIMGAGAFIMAEYVELPYISIAIAAALPAFLFYVSIMATVYLTALKSGIPALSKDKIPNLFLTLKNYGHLMPPIFILIGLLLSGWSLMWAAFWSIVSLVALAMLRKLTRLSVPAILDALGDATQKAIPVAVACAAAGLIYGIISATGLGFTISSSLVSLAGGSKILVLVFSMLSGILLGFAMPPTAAYIILAALIVPSLTDVGLEPLVAHMFLFIFCCIGPITPPVALAAYSASGISGSEPNKTGFTAFRIGLGAYIIPFLFVYSPRLLLLGDPLPIIGTGMATMVGLLLLVVGIEGYFAKRLNWSWRVLIFLIVVAIFISQSLL
jgi:TRAP transporter 4TM/12TM fusion protein